MIERLLVVGLGGIGRRHVHFARTVVPGLRVAAWRHRVSVNPPPGEVEGVERCVWTLADALAFKPDAAVIASPAAHHLAAARELADAGIHLLVEKPIAASAAGVGELVELCARRGVTLMTGYNLRFLPSISCFRALIHKGTVGRVLSVRAEVGQFLPGWRPGADYRQTASAQASLGGGALLELSHELDYLRWIFGEIEWVQAVLLRQSALEIDVEDTAHLVLGFAPMEGATPVVASLNLDFVRHDTTRNCTVIGSEGTLRWDVLAGTVQRLGAGTAQWETLAAEPVARDVSYLAEWRHFFACVESGARPLIDGSDGLAVVRLADAARESAARGAVVRLPPVSGSAAREHIP